MLLTATILSIISKFRLHRNDIFIDSIVLNEIIMLGSTGPKDTIGPLIGVSRPTNSVRFNRIRSSLTLINIGVGRILFHQLLLGY
jgi:hypothetical protein